jgi:hypothetical protein
MLPAMSLAISFGEGLDILQSLPEPLAAHRLVELGIANGLSREHAINAGMVGELREYVIRDL